MHYTLHALIHLTLTNNLVVGTNIITLPHLTDEETELQTER